MIMGMDLIKTCDGLKISSGKLEFCNLLLKSSSTPRDATIEIGTNNAYFDGEKWIVSWEWENEPNMKNQTRHYK